MESRGDTRRWRAPFFLVILPACVALLAMVGSELFLSPTFGWNLAWTAAATSALGGMIFARAGARVENRPRLTLWAAAAGSWLAGQIAWDIFAAVGTPDSPNVADAGYWGFALLVVVSLVRAPARSRTLKAFAAAETATLIAAALALVFAELWPVATKSGLPVSARMSALAYPAVYVSAAVLTLQAIVGGSLRRVRTVALPLVLSGIVAQAVAFIF